MTCSPLLRPYPYCLFCLSNSSRRLSQNMKPPFPSFTAEWHDDTYDAIDISRPDLSVKGKKIVISGGGAGIGRGFTQAFADAGATSIAILGRRDALLQETKQEVTSKNKTVSISTHVADVTDITAVKKAAEHIGGWDILISNAGYLSTAAPIVESDPNDWWTAFEVINPSLTATGRC